MRLTETFLNLDGEEVLHEKELRAITLGVRDGEEYVTMAFLVDDGRRQIEMRWRRDELQALLLRAKGR